MVVVGGRDWGWGNLTSCSEGPMDRPRIGNDDTIESMTYRLLESLEVNRFAIDIELVCFSCS